MQWDTVIGLEVHAQLKTKSKLFSPTANKFGKQPNVHTNYIDAGLPGVLPVMNKEALIMAVKFGLAINAKVNNKSYFERKNYFYPDLPKGYQISQYQCPIVSGGSILIHLSESKEKVVDLTRAHLEEDAGKLLHDLNILNTGVDLNRAGIPLLEIVTEPCLFSAEEAVCTLKTLHQLVCFLGICDGNMQEGSLRCDVNISLKPKGSSKLGTRIELKNLNSFRFVEKAIIFEQERQQSLLEKGHTIKQETRLFSEATGETELLRSKENESDYRYFPDPDLLPMNLASINLDLLKQNLPVLPEQILKNLKQNKDLSQEDLEFVLLSPKIYIYMQNLQKLCHMDEKQIINWLKGPLATALHNNNLTFDDLNSIPVEPALLAKLLNYLVDQKISHHIAKQIFTKLWAGENELDQLIAAFSNNNANARLEELIPQILTKFPAQVAQFQAGKEKLLAFFVGQIMKELKGKGDPTIISEYLQKFLKTGG